jgi:hypothetical protein
MELSVWARFGGHFSNPSYSGGENQEDYDSRITQGKS